VIALLCSTQKSEDKDRKELLYACRQCPYFEKATNPCVYAHDLIVSTRESAGVTQDLGSDPTLPRANEECPKCHARENVYYQGQGKRTDTKMTLFFVCLNPHCGKTFTTFQNKDGPAHRYDAGERPDAFMS